MAEVAIYLRCSTEEQTTDNQLSPLQRWIADRGHELVEVYSENESAWRNGHQRKLAKLFSDIRKRRIDICLVWGLDRLTREGIARVFELISKFKASGVQVISYQEPWTKQSGMMADPPYAITAWVANYEPSRILPRVSEAPLG